MTQLHSQHEDQSKQLSWQEREELNKCEAAIRANLSYYRELGEALKTIRDKRLYRQSYSTFDSYLKSQWNMVRSYAYHIIDASELANEIQEMSTRVDILPAGPTVLRALSPIPKEERAAVYLDIVEENDGQTPTRAQVTESVTNERIGRLDTDRTTKKQAEAPPARSPFRKGFHVSAFKYDADNQKFHFQVFKPGNSFKGWEPKTENLQITLDDLAWELRNVGFTLVPISEIDAEDAQEATTTPVEVAVRMSDSKVPLDAAGRPMKPKLIEYYQRTEGLYLDYVIPAEVPAVEDPPSPGNGLNAFFSEDEPAPSFTAGMDLAGYDDLAQPFEDYPQ